MSKQAGAHTPSRTQVTRKKRRNIARLRLTLALITVESAVPCYRGSGLSVRLQLPAGMITGHGLRWLTLDVRSPRNDTHSQELSATELDANKATLH